MGPLGEDRALSRVRQPLDPSPACHGPVIKETAVTPRFFLAPLSDTLAPVPLLRTKQGGRVPTCGCSGESLTRAAESNGLVLVGEGLELGIVRLVGDQLRLLLVRELPSTVNAEHEQAVTMAFQAWRDGGESQAHARPPLRSSSGLGGNGPWPRSQS